MLTRKYLNQDSEPDRLNKAEYFIIGARTLEHLKDNLGCLQVALSEEQLICLNVVSEVDPGFALKFLRRLQNLFLGAANETLDLSLHPVSRLVLDRK